MLDIDGSYHCLLFQRKPMKETWENAKKNLVLAPILVSLAKIWAQKFFS